MGTIVDSGTSSWADYNYTTTTTTQYYTYSNPNLKYTGEQKMVDRKERVLKRFQEIPVFAKLFELGAFSRGTGLLISENYWDAVFKMLSTSDTAHLTIFMVNSTKEGIFFKNMSPGLGTIVIYGLFDEDESTLTKANFIKRANSLLVPTGNLVLLTEKEHPDNLKDLIAFAGVEGKITDIDMDIKTRGIVLTKN